MLKSVVDIITPCLVFVLMLVVGLELTVADFRRAADRLWLVALATLVPVILWPLVGVALLALLPLKPYIGTGLLLIAACPSGGMANFYTYVGRANLPLSVTLSAVSCLTAVATMPLVLSLLQPHLGEPYTLDVPIPLMVGQLLLLLILPTLLGMGARRAWPGLAERHGRTLLRVGLVALAVLLALVLVQEGEHIAGDLAEIALTVTVLTLLMVSAGFATAAACGQGATDGFTLAMTFAVRNVGIATAVAVTVLGRTEFAVFAAAYFVSQTPLLLAALLLFRLVRPPVPETSGVK